ncbi:MAG: PH domain-containing protein [Cyanobacteria bacterium J06642_2]
MTATALARDCLWRGKPSQLLNLPHIATSLLVIGIIAFGHKLIWSSLESPLAGVLSDSQLAQFRTYFLYAVAAIAISPVFTVLWRMAVLQSISYSLFMERFIERHGVLNRSTNNLELFRVKDIGLRQDFFERVIGLGTIILYTSDTSCPIVQLTGIEDAERALELIRDRVNVERNRKNVREFDVN